MSSAFDPKVFQQMTFTEGNSTESVPIPVGEWNFEITKAEVTTWENKEKTNSGLKLYLGLQTSDDEVVKVTGRPKNVVKYEIMLDMNEEKTGLDFGKGMNVQLGRAREACGLNKPGQPFNFDMFLGRNVRAQIGHRIIGEGQDQRPVADCKGIVLPKAAAGSAASGYVPGA